MAAKKKTTKKVESRELVTSIFTGEKAYKWRIRIDDLELECTSKVYTTSSRAISAGKKFLKDNLK